MMRGDCDLHVAYGAAKSVVLTLRTATAPYPVINVTGYTGELRCSRYDGTPHGVTLLTVACTVNGPAGTFTALVSGAQALALAATFGDPVPTQYGRWSLWVTPPAGNAFPAGHGWLRLHQLGEPVTPTAQDAYEQNFSISLEGLAGPAGPAGAAGPQGPAGSTAIDITTTPTSTTTETTIQSITVPLGDWSVRVKCSVTDGVTTDTFEELWSGTNTAGAVAVTSTKRVFASVSLFGEIQPGTAANAVLVRALPVASALTWKAWSALEGS